MKANKYFDDVLFFVTFIATIYLLFFLTGCQGRQGIAGAQGAPGATGQQGVAGDPGVDGAQGPQGLQGPAGADGTIITIVQFCPGVVTYPTVFPEVGECINGKLYAVYSANDGFLTEIVDGTYNSNAVGSACNFTVVGCAVSQ